MGQLKKIKHETNLYIGLNSEYNNSRSMSLRLTELSVESLDQIMSHLEPKVVWITSIALGKNRHQTLLKWIRSQKVCVDTGGFFVYKYYAINFDNPGEEDKTRVRIKLWDQPLYYRKMYEFVSILDLKEEFYPMIYKPTYDLGPVDLSRRLRQSSSSPSSRSSSSSE